MAKPLYHLHLDAAHLPAPLLDRMLQEGGFHWDDFPHEFEVGGQKLPARHLTKYLYHPATAETAKVESLRLDGQAKEYGLVGLIQCEFVMEEIEWKKSSVSVSFVPPPFEIHTRPLSDQKGDRFKKHELHLEVKREESSMNVIEALKLTGFQILEGESTVTFTTNGPSKVMLSLREALREFLESFGATSDGKLTYEATAFWSLHGIDPKTLPPVIDRIVLLGYPKSTTVNQRQILQMV